MDSKRDVDEKRSEKRRTWKKPTLPPEPRNADELDVDGQPPHHPGAATTPGAGPNPTPPVTGR